MQTYEVIAHKRDERGMTTAELSRRASIDYESLRVSLAGNRKLTGDELVSLCRILNLDLSDFVAKTAID